MATVIDYPDFSVHITSPQTAVVVQDLLNDLRDAEASEVGIIYPHLIDASGKDTLAAGVQTGITLKLRDPWQLEFYAGDYRATIEGGNLVSDRADNNVIKFVVGGPQIEILRSAAATIVTEGGSVPSAPQNAAAVRSELTTELARLMDMAKQDGVVAGTPVVITPTSRTAGDVSQTISEVGGTVTVTRA
jgi:hypothetical protein